MFEVDISPDDATMRMSAGSADSVLGVEYKPARPKFEVGFKCPASCSVQLELECTCKGI